MIKLPAGLELQRVAAYAAIAALVTGVLFAADGAYRWYEASGPSVAAPSVHERTAETLKPPSAESAAASGPAHAPASAPQAEPRTAEDPSEVKPVAVQAPHQPGSPMAGAESAPASSTAAATVPGGSAPGLTTDATRETTTQSADVAQQIAPPPLPPSRPALRTPPAKQATRERAAPRRPVQAAEKPPVRAKKTAEQPNVYWERDEGSQLGFAPQLRKKTCDPATGQMPMQCYYPREGRERFPAKPLN